MAKSPNASEMLIEALGSRPDGCALFLDFDGTLVDLAPTPDAVDVPAQLRGLLMDLSTYLGGALAIITGREVADIDKFLSLPELGVVGSHGAIFRLSDEDGLEQSNTAQLLSDSLRESLRSLAAQLDCLVEDKGYSVALHYRDAPERAPALHTRIDQLLADCDAHARPVLMAGKMLYEVKFDTYNKGTALDSLMTRTPFVGRQPIFIGDDVTDTYAFEKSVAHGGFGLSVGQRLAHTSAVFESPLAVRQALSHALGGASASSRGVS